jgi:hypothetical protein
MQGSDGIVLNLKLPSLYIYIVDGGISLLANNLLMAIPVALSKTYLLYVGGAVFTQ